MPDLRDGASAQAQGSARTPYILKNVGGVYSCTCPAWRNQSLSIERRTCKHLRSLRGEKAEQERLGSLSLPTQASTTKDMDTVPKLLLAQSWDNETDLTDW
jgi:DNA ligase-1